MKTVKVTEALVVAYKMHQEEKAPSNSIAELKEEGEGNNKNSFLNQENAEAPISAPLDKYKLVFLIFVLHGVGALMPWNMFINAKDYFEKFKLDPAYVTVSDDDVQWYSTNFFIVLFWAAQLPNLVFNWLNLVLPCGGSVKKRIVLSLTVEVVVCVVTVILAFVNTSQHPKMFFWLTMLSVATINIAGGFYQNSIYGIGAKIGYPEALVLGSNLSGVFTSLTSVVIHTTQVSQLKSAMFYFSASALIIILCLVSYSRLPSFKFYRYHYDELHCKEDSVEAQPRDNLSARPIDKKEKKTLNLSVLKRCWVQCFNVFMVYFVTLVIFPGVHANVKAVSKDFVINDEQRFVEVTCFLTFNLTALLGNLLAGWVQWPKPNCLWMPVVLRLFLIPFFLLCNYHPIGFTRNCYVWFGDWMYWMGSMVLGLTNGYFGSLAMMYCPRVVKCDQAATAGMLGIAFLVTGVFLGGNFSAAMPYIIGIEN